jgi:hypothetical protein
MNKKSESDTFQYAKLKCGASSVVIFSTENFASVSPCHTVCAILHGYKVVKEITDPPEHYVCYVCCESLVKD